MLKEASTRPISRTLVSDKVDQRKPALLVDKNRTDRWKATGVIALAQANLKVYREGPSCSTHYNLVITTICVVYTSSFLGCGKGNT